MKVVLITRHAVPNYGSLLQTIATKEAIENLGCSCEIIDYIRKDEKVNGICKALLKRNKKWNKNIIRKTIFTIYNGLNYHFMYYFFKMKNDKLITEKTKEYNTIEELKKDLPIGDIYCSGSDQLWGSIGASDYDPVYFLDFVQNGERCISYAGSFGSDCVGQTLNRALPSLLKKYKYISVREKSAQEILKNVNVKSDLVLDPTFLVTKQQWIDKFDLRIKNEKYILVYQLHNNKKFDNYVKELSKEKKLKIYRITSTLLNISKKGKKIYLPTIKDFLESFYNAEYIVTDSFHGTVFSIIFNIKFLSISPGATSTRIESLLNLFEISERYLNDFSSLNSIDKSIDWSAVNQKKNLLRNKSIEWLDNSIYK